MANEEAEYEEEEEEEEDDKDAAEADAQGEKKGASIDDYLQSPRRKRRKFVICAYGTKLPMDLPGTLQGYLRSHHKSMALSHPRNNEDLKKAFAKVIRLLVFDDGFTEMDLGLNMISAMKQRKIKSPVPVMFLTADPAELIRRYNQVLAPFHEFDDYIDYSRTPTPQILSRIRTALATQNRRRSRRYKVDIPLNFYNLTIGKTVQGRLLDLSVHGALLRIDSDHIFRPTEQLKISLPIHDLDPTRFGDFLRISARVRRVLISGTHAGISFEFVSEKQLMVLTHFLTDMVNSQVARHARQMRARGR